MSEHSQRERYGPGAGSVIGGAVAALGAGAATIYSATGEVVTGQSVAGSLLGVGLSVLLLFQAAMRALERMDAQDKARREAGRQERAEELRRASTATWYGPAAGQVLTVRFEAHSGRFWVLGRINREWTVRRETRWRDMTGLIQIIMMSEMAETLTPARDVGTAMVRQRLGLAPLETVAAVLEEAGAEEAVTLPVLPGGSGERVHVPADRPGEGRNAETTALERAMEGGGHRHV